MGLLDKYPHGKDTYLFGFGLSIETHCNEIQYISDMLYAEAVCRDLAYDF